ncbi:MAG: sel1 repeat family protein [Verrucomicrobia bacterium]|nr:MAG: sel1 repeat family protein [Verrucomicrobiota bacterium]
MRDSITAKITLGSFLALIAITASLVAGEKPASGKPPSPASMPLPGAESLQDGDALMLADRASDALREYENAALHGNAEAGGRLGNLLLFGCKSFKTTQGVTANPAEGVRWTFVAATNRVASACENLGKAYELGIGVKTNLVEAYAWMRLARSFKPDLKLTHLDQLAVRLDSAQVRQAQELAETYRRGNWPTCPVKRLVNGDSRLTLNGVTMGGRTPLAVINRQTFALGESGMVRLRDGSLRILCAEIGGNSVTVEVEGEAEAHLLLMQ